MTLKDLIQVDMKKYLETEYIKTATIEDLKQNEHVQGLLKCLGFYSDPLNWYFSYKNIDKNEFLEISDDDKDSELSDKEIYGGKQARAKLRKWEDV